MILIVLSVFHAISGPMFNSNVPTLKFKNRISGRLFGEYPILKTANCTRRQDIEGQVGDLHELQLSNVPWMLSFPAPKHTE
mmetsp:Transcript_49873/g.67863  ORF Transcript_49873/g.67863 Transcript_49873/m.67863 type:complete len:81 (-) Transcript_49873:304-546(-)